MALKGLLDGVRSSFFICNRKSLQGFLGGRMAWVGLVCKRSALVLKRYQIINYGQLIEQLLTIEDKWLKYA